MLASSTIAASLTGRDCSLNVPLILLTESLFVSNKIGCLIEAGIQMWPILRGGTSLNSIPFLQINISLDTGDPPIHKRGRVEGLLLFL